MEELFAQELAGTEVFGGERVLSIPSHKNYTHQHDRGIELNLQLWILPE